MWVFIFLFSNEGILCGRFNNKYAAKWNVDFGWCRVGFFLSPLPVLLYFGLQKCHVSKIVTLFAGELLQLHISFASNTLESASDAWFLVFRVLGCFVPQRHIAVSKHRSDLKNVSTHQADSGGCLGWGFFVGGVFVFCPEDFFMYYQKRQSKLQPEFFLFIFLWCILHINVSE